MTKKELITKLRYELREIHDDPLYNPDQAYKWIKEKVNKFTSDKVRWDSLLDPIFKQYRFICWEDVAGKLLHAVGERESKKIQGLTTEVNLDVDNFYLDKSGKLKNIDKNILEDLINSLLAALDDGDTAREATKCLIELHNVKYNTLQQAISTYIDLILKWNDTGIINLDFLLRPFYSDEDVRYYLEDYLKFKMNNLSELKWLNDIDFNLGYYVREKDDSLRNLNMDDIELLKQTIEKELEALRNE